MAQRTYVDVNRLYLAAQSDFETDPSPDGSSYVPVRVKRAVMPTHGRTKFETEEATGRNRRTAGEAGPDASEIQVEAPLVGLPALAGDGVTPTSADWLRLLLESVLGASQDVLGEGVNVGSTASTLALDGDVLAAGQLVCVQGASLNGGRSQWRPVTGSTSPYGVSPDWAATPTGSEIAYGSRQYTGEDSDKRPLVGSPLAGVVETDREIFNLLGGRPTSMLFRMDAQGRCMVNTTIRFDRRNEDATAKTALPIIPPPTQAAIQGVKSPVYWGTTEIKTKMLELDLGLTVENDPATGCENGLQDIEVLGINPVLKIEPRYDRAVWEAEFAANTQRSVLAQFGGGIVSGAFLNSLCYHTPASEVLVAEPTQDGKRLRHAVSLAAVDAGDSSFYFRLARA